MSGTIAFNHATLIAPSHPLNGQRVSIKYGEGLILELSKEPLSADKVFDVDGAFLTPGWLDVFAKVPDPGADWKESLPSFAQTAWEAGFTHSAVLAGTDPLPEKSSAITSVLSRSKDFSTKLLPLGAASESFEGKEMAEVYELFEAGSIAQTDGIQAHATDGLRARLFEYCHSLGINYLVHPYNPKWAPGGQVHEGAVCVNLGLKGIPEISETSALLADIELAKWLNVPLKVLGITSKRSLDIIKHARKEGVNIHVAVAIMNLMYTEHDIANFDERFKVLPPLRTELDRQALRNGVLNGEIQAIFSNHDPQDVESQKVEFDYADFGAATMSEFVPRLMEQFSSSEIVDLLGILGTSNREFLGVTVPNFEPGSVADFTIVSPNLEITSINHSSKAYNKLPEVKSKTGRLFAVIRGSHISVNP